MSVLLVEAWKCDRVECGHVWYTGKTETPTACGKCKSRSWNKSESAPAPKTAARAKEETPTEQPPAPALKLQRPRPPVDPSLPAVEEPHEEVVQAVVSRPASIHTGSYARPERHPLPCYIYRCGMCAALKGQ